MATSPHIPAPIGAVPDPDLLIAEAHRRARRRRLRYAALSAAVVAVAGAMAAVSGGFADRPMVSGAPATAANGLVRGVPAPHNGPVTFLDKSGTYDAIYTRTADGGTRGVWVCTGECEGIADFSWSPDGTRLAVIAISDRRPPLSLYEGIHVLDLEADTDLQITNRSGDLRSGDSPSYSFAWSRDSSRLVYSDGYGSDVGIVRADGSHRRLIDTDVRQVGNPAFSRDGQQLLLEGNGSLWLMGMGAASAHRLTHLGAGSAAWSPTDDVIAVSARCGFRMLNPSGRLIARAHSCPASDDEIDAWPYTHLTPWPRWSPDGHKLIMVDNSFGGSARGIWTMNADGSGLRRLDREFGFDPTGYAGVEWRPVA